MNSLCLIDPFSQNYVPLAMTEMLNEIMPFSADMSFQCLNRPNVIHITFLCINNVIFHFDYVLFTLQSTRGKSEYYWLLRIMTLTFVVVSHEKRRKLTFSDQ